MHRRWGRGEGCQGLDGLLVFRGVPPVQELEEEDADGQAGGQGEGDAAQSSPQGRLHSGGKAVAERKKQGEMVTAAHLST